MSTHHPSSTPESSSKPASSVYGPVKSWRAGNSLGIDLLLQTSICSFNCIYCQLGDIQLKTIERKIYVPTETVMADLQQSPWQDADIITLSGNGEPTLALNLGEVIQEIKAFTQKPVMVLTNATTLNDEQVIEDLKLADQIACKLDAASDEGLKQMNRPVPGVSLNSIVSGIKKLRAQYKGKMSLQCMFMPTNLSQVDEMAQLIEAIHPDEVQLNTPKRPYPLEFHVESRGNHGSLDLPKDFPSRVLRVVEPPQADEIEALLKQKTTVPVLSIYNRV